MFPILAMKKFLPLILTVILAGWFLGNLSVPPDKDFAYSQFGALPLVFNNHIQPINSLTQNSLLQLHKKQTLNTKP